MWFKGIHERGDRIRVQNECKQVWGVQLQTALVPSAAVTKQYGLGDRNGSFL